MNHYEIQEDFSEKGSYRGKLIKTAGLYTGLVVAESTKALVVQKIQGAITNNTLEISPQAALVSKDLINSGGFELVSIWDCGFDFPPTRLIKSPRQFVNEFLNFSKRKD